MLFQAWGAASVAGPAPVPPCAPVGSEGPLVSTHHPAPGRSPSPVPALPLLVLGPLAPHQRDLILLWCAGPSVVTGEGARVEAHGDVEPLQYACRLLVWHWSANTVKVASANKLVGGVHTVCKQLLLQSYVLPKVCYI